MTKYGKLYTNEIAEYFIVIKEHLQKTCKMTGY